MTQFCANGLFGLNYPSQTQIKKTLKMNDASNIIHSTARITFASFFGTAIEFYDKKLA
jgi:hypothetical protein